MEAAARSHTRIPLEAHRLFALPDLVGTESGSLAILKSSGTRTGPPQGSVRFQARWSADGLEGEAEVLVLPLWQWGGEVEITLARPDSAPAKMRWGTHRLQRLAEGLAVALGGSVRRRTGTVFDRDAGAARGARAAARKATRNAARAMSYRPAPGVR